MTEWLVLAYLALLGAWVTYEDLRYGKIRNRLLGISLVVGVLWNLWLFVHARLGLNDFVPADRALAYLGAVGLDTAISLLLGFVMWLFRLWAAGDAKLFAVLTLLLPLRYYKENLLAYFPSFVLFFNTFIVFFALLALEFLVKVTVRFFRGRLYRQHGVAWALFRDKVLARPLNTLKVVVGLLVLFLIIKWIRVFLRDWLWEGFHLNQTLLFVVLFVVLEPLRDFFRKPWVFGTCLTGLVSSFAYWAVVGDYASMIDVVSMSLFVILLLVFKALYDLYTDHFDVREVMPVELHPGTVLSDRQLVKLTSDSEFNNERFGTMEADGLSAEQVEVLVTWLVKNKPEERLEVCNTIPFTPGIVLGTLATVIFAGYVFVV